LPYFAIILPSLIEGLAGSAGAVRHERRQSACPRAASR